jgi:hypothetical protein
VKSAKQIAFRYNDDPTTEEIDLGDPSKPKFIGFSSPTTVSPTTAD